MNAFLLYFKQTDEKLYENSKCLKDDRMQIMHLVFREFDNMINIIYRRKEIHYQENSECLISSNCREM